ncbi:inositol monophosphatase [bacterium]|nr:inositol monophosphatase [bacterium]
MANATSISRLRDTLQKTVLQSGRLLKRKLSDQRSITFKSEIDMVTEMDQQVEQHFVKTISKNFPDHEILSEELIEASGQSFPEKPASRGRYRWIIDPVDGTTNYAHRFPHFSVSAGIEHQGKMIMGAVYNPMLNEFFYAEKGKGAWLNTKPIRVSKTKIMRQALLATGFPYDLKISTLNNFREFFYFSRHCQAIRRAGSASLDLCDVACGRFDGFWEYKLKPWDVAAAALIIHEAGGRITNLQGKTLTIYGGTFLASNRILHSDLVQMMRKADQATITLGK